MARLAKDVIPMKTTGKGRAALPALIRLEGVCKTYRAGDVDMAGPQWRPRVHP
jgi:hypothetical protein